MLSIFATAEEMEKKTSGTTTMNNRLINTSPKGLRILAFSPKIRPIIEPIIIEESSINGKRYAFNLLDKTTTPFLLFSKICKILIQVYLLKKEKSIYLEYCNS